MKVQNIICLMSYILITYMMSLKDTTAKEVRERFLGTSIITSILYWIILQ